MSTAPSGLSDDFDQDHLGTHWKPWVMGSGRLELGAGALRCVIDLASSGQYSDAQITSYLAVAGHKSRWTPPLRLTVRAWASHPAADLRGTAGFGFWNEPFARERFRLPRLPRAVWFFFGSPPNNMALAQGVPGWGWKAAALDALRLPALLLAPLAPLGFLLMRVPAFYRALWPLGQRAIGASEALLPVDLAEPHTYTLEWRRRSVIFAVDGEPVHRTSSAPRGPQGFIAWMDNQYAVVTPQGRFKFGLLTTDQPQWLALDRIELQPLEE